MHKPIDGIFASPPSPLEEVPIAPSPPVRPVVIRRRIGFGDFLVFTVALACIYIMGGPYWPSLLPTPTVPAVHAAPAPTSLAVTSQNPQPTAAPTATPIPGPNTLVIPEIGVNAPIVDSTSEDALNQGIWHPSYTSDPEKGGNTVLAAHRWLYTKGPRTFYYLDRLKVGDQFTITWNGKLYTYTIFETKVVTNQAVDIENATPDAEVTLFTCTPLWSSANRLVVRARLT